MRPQNAFAPSSPWSMKESVSPSSPVASWASSCFCFLVAAGSGASLQRQRHAWFSNGGIQKEAVSLGGGGRGRSPRAVIFASALQFPGPFHYHLDKHTNNTEPSKTANKGGIIVGEHA